MIKLKGISKLFESKEGNVLALNNLDLNVDKGDIYGIMGFSGAGKSTLIRCINLLERPTSGEVWVDGVSLTRLPTSLLRQSRKDMGMIFQHYHLLASKNVERNISYPLEIHGFSKNDIKIRVEELLSLVGLEDKKEHFPAQLSGGQRQRVAIARALATNPKILLSDEATSALDPITSRNILNLLKEINKKFAITIVLITHQIEVIEQICDKVAVLENGSIVERGDVSSVFKNPQNPYTKLLLGYRDPGKNEPISINTFRKTKAGGL